MPYYESQLVTVGIDATGRIIDGKRYTLISSVIELTPLSLAILSFNYFNSADTHSLVKREREREKG